MNKTQPDVPLEKELMHSIGWFRQMLKTQEPEIARSYLIKEYSRLAETYPEADLFPLGAELERALCYPVAWDAMSSRPDQQGRDIPDWGGENLTGKRLLFERRTRDTGADLKMGRLLELAGRQAGQCTALIEDRLLPLFNRSFPSVTFQATTEVGRLHDHDLLCGYEVLGRYLTPTCDSIRRQFIPLKPDENLTKDLRSEYAKQSAGRKIVGLSWHSSNKNKDMPPLSTWARLVADLPFQCVSINYGDRSKDIAFLEDRSGKTVLADPIDQMASLDGLAAQIAAVDSVVSISNTTAHLAGALGLPVHLVLTAFIGMPWPHWDNRIPWYPKTLLHRIAESWDITMQQIAATLVEEDSSG